MIRYSQLAAAVCPAKLAPDGGSLSLVVAKLPHAADECDEGLQRTPEIESSLVTTAVWQIHSNPSYDTSINSSSNEQSKYHTNQATQQANREDDRHNTDEAEAATPAAAAVVAARAPSPQANERRMAKETPLRMGSKGNKNNCCLSLQLGVADTAGHIYCSLLLLLLSHACTSGDFSRNEEGSPRSSLDISHTPPISGKVKYYMDSSRELLSNALIETTEGELQRSWWRRCRGHLKEEKREKKI